MAADAARDAHPSHGHRVRPDGSRRQSIPAARFREGAARPPQPAGVDEPGDDAAGAPRPRLDISPATFAVVRGGMADAVLGSRWNDVDGGPATRSGARAGLVPGGLLSRRGGGLQRLRPLHDAGGAVPVHLRRLLRRHCGERDEPPDAAAPGVGSGDRRVGGRSADGTPRRPVRSSADAGRQPDHCRALADGERAGRRVDVHYRQSLRPSRDGLRPLQAVRLQLPRQHLHGRWAADQ